MVLDNFRKINITLNKANQHILEPQITKVGDVNGRELVVQLIDGGVIKDQTGVVLKLNWQHANGNQGAETFSPLDAKQGLFSVYYPENMLFRGTVTANISINENGKITNSLNFQIAVKGDVFDGSAVEVDGILFTLKDLKDQLDERDGNLASLENRQSSVENQFSTLQQEMTGKDVISAPEIIAARGGEPTLSARLDKDHQEVTAQLVETTSDLQTITVVGEKDTLIVDASNAVNGDATNVAMKKDSYVVTENLYPLAEPIVMTGRGSITQLNHNNRYFDIFDPRHSGGVLTKLNPSYDSANLDKFKTALATAKGGGAKVKVTFVGDSLTQGGHRKDDNFFWVEQLKNKLVERYGDYFTFYNRGWAGRVISSLNNVISTPINAPFEADWVTSSGTKTWLQYIADTSPDLIISAFGMNEQDADVYVDLANGRTALKGITSNPDIVWVTTPICTINTEAVNNGTFFGRYPTNEFPNTAGIVTRLFAQRMGDGVIDVNRNTSIAMLGLDPYQYRMDRWAGQYRKTDNQFTAPVGAITGGTSVALNIAVRNNQTITTNRLFRNSSVEFTPTGTLDNVRIWFRRDTSSDSYTMIQLNNGHIKIYGRRIESLSIGEIGSWIGDCRNKRVRIDVIGTIIKVYVDGSEILSYKNNLTSQFLSPITFQAMSPTTDSMLNNVIINGDYYKKYLPRISANEAFNVNYGDGGNGLNHPNTRGELEFYSQPLDEFISDI